MRVELDRLYPVYAFDTACFYTDEEAELDRRLQELRHTLAEKQKNGIEKEEKSELTGIIGATKQALKDKIDENKNVVRQVRPEAVRNGNVVQVFESTLVRCLGMSASDVNLAMVIVKVYYFGVAESIIKNGFEFNGNHYVFFSASAGQIRTKKFVAIREDLLKGCMDKLTCGLSVEDINAQGGINVNKYLAYLALCNSATDEWPQFNIDRSIVVDDFETVVNGVVDFIDEKDYSVTRREQGVPITHTDGCGMMLPSVSTKNFMVRAPWIKGLLSPFPFDRYIREANLRDPSRDHAIIKDIYGVEHDVLKEKINVIFTKSQFKLWKFYENWDDYKTRFKRFGCTASVCNVEPTMIKKATINYQMLQTLTGMTDSEIETLCQKTNVVLRNLTCDKETMLRVLGVRRDSRALDPTQKCLKEYPPLLRDQFFKNQLRDKKKSIEHDSRAGKLMIDCKYQFLIPDLYAACQYWFDRVEIPEGLLSNGEVWTREYPYKEKLDVLRSPHLYKEHAVRTNVYQTKPELKKWFRTNGIYTSTFDMVSKILQFDNDGDKSLVVAEPVVVEAAERECSDIVPLYYPMAKAPAHEISPEIMYDGMVAAWTGGNIGAISNTISKIWAENPSDINSVKVLCMENNFVIDYAKTLYKPTRPEEWNEKLKKYESGKLPQFFKYAKDKADKQINAPCDGIIDKLYNHIKINKFRFANTTIEPLDWKMLMFNPERTYGEKEEAIVNEFRNASSKLQLIGKGFTFDDGSHNLYEVKKLKDYMNQFGRRQDVCDVLIRGIFDKHPTPNKAAFWMCYNDVVFDNLMTNLNADKRSCDEMDLNTLEWRECNICGSEYKARESDTLDICPACRVFNSKARTRKCLDCGTDLPPTTKPGGVQLRCERCQKIHRQVYYAEKKREYRARK